MEFFQTLIDSNPDAVAILDEQNRLLVWNQNYAALWGETDAVLGHMSNEERWTLQRRHLANPQVAHGLFPALVTPSAQHGVHYGRAVLGELMRFAGVAAAAHRAVG